MAKFQGGLGEMIKALSLLSKDERDKLLKNLALKDQALADIIKSQLNSLEDLRYISPKMLVEFLRAVDLKKLGHALKLYPEDVRNHLYMRVSDSMGQEMKEACEQEKIPKSQAQEEHGLIMEVFRRMIDEGKIIISKDDKLV
ncbi:FliG C-terminal domain-containing protein [Bacteriovorax sp. Seq25_V]|uniref:FliG C-terminal domain-containing protein n=1 Tax=Bacteriovorax sp. Seq25_V TaxID=1201288 RepID=UPI00038A5342|nr:FliG C-terminal domain-containing protein [Bacteriovorax sp. Seq25_V]EQC46024.1 FliG C-terminal domain protein [Bacteriovorax sp. Seq25_V]